MRLRLVPARHGYPFMIRFTDEEWAAVAAAAAKLDVGVSFFLRSLGVAAGAKHHERAQREVPPVLHALRIIEWAADDAHMVLNEWLRVIALSAIGYTTLGDHLKRARQALRTGLPPGVADTDVDEEAEKA